MSNPRAVKYRRLALAEEDKERADLLGSSKGSDQTTELICRAAAPDPRPHAGVLDGYSKPAFRVGSGLRGNCR